jgi:transcriptional regulator GlxA family with amidase domain
MMLGTRQLIDDEVTRAWLQTVHPHTTFTTSMCTGSLLLAAAGLLDGLTATTHWSAADRSTSWVHATCPTGSSKHPPQRIITAAGVYSGIDMALRLVELLVDREAAQAAQLLIEYDPQPPFDSGSLAKADAATKARADEYRQSRK